MWKATDPQGNEAAKVKYDIVPYTRGRGLDLGCGPFKAFPHFIGVDNGHHAKEFGWQIKPDVSVDTCENLDVFGSQSLDFVFSSHLLEHIVDTKKTLKEWWRVIKPGGHLVLYLPHKDLYPNMGQEGANPDHKHDFLPADITETMRAIGDWHLVVNETRGDGQEYSFLQVYKKQTNGKQVEGFGSALVPQKRVCVVRYGGIGDILQAATLCPGLKEQGYHVTLMTTPNGEAMLRGNPSIDAYVIQDQDQVPNEELGPYWSTWAKKFDKFVNLCESIEGTLLALPNRVNHAWSLDARQRILGTVSYYERLADMAGVPYNFAPPFYPTDEEKSWANKQRAAMPAGDVIMLSLGGSSIHKAYPYNDDVLYRLTSETGATVVLVGDTPCQLLEEGSIQGMLLRYGVPENLVNEAIAEEGLAGLETLVLRLFGSQRVICQSGKWSLRQVLTFLDQCVLVVGQETGVLNAAAFMPLAKVVTLSHSSPVNLCTHWINTTAVMAGADCQPCHRMHYDRSHCPEHKETSASMCMGLLSSEELVGAIIKRLPRVKLHAIQ